MMFPSASAQAPQTNVARVVAMVPVFNRIASTVQCLADLKAQTYPALDIVVVDGGSTDGTQEIIRRDHQDVRLIADRGELWWTDAMALAVDEVAPSLSEGDYLFLVNNDTLLQPDTIARLIETSGRNSHASVAALVREARGHLVAAGVRMCWGPLSLGVPLGCDEEKLKGRDVLPADVVFGRATLVPVVHVRQAGNFDGVNFPQYYGDSEFFLRVSRTGAPVIIDATTVVGCREDEANTGIHYVGKRRQALSLKRAWQMLTSRRSNLNLPDGIRFIMKMAPPGRKALCVLILVVSNLAAVAHAYLDQFAVYRFVLYTLRKVRALVRRIRALSSRVDVIYLNFAEMRRYGLDPVRLLDQGKIRMSGVPHTYHMKLSLRGIARDWRLHRRLLLRAINPFVRWRLRNFVKAWTRRANIGALDGKGQS